MKNPPEANSLCHFSSLIHQEESCLTLLTSESLPHIFSFHFNKLQFSLIVEIRIVVRGPSTSFEEEIRRN